MPRRVVALVSESINDTPAKRGDNRLPYRIVNTVCARARTNARRQAASSGKSFDASVGRRYRDRFRDRDRRGRRDAVCVRRSAPLVARRRRRGGDSAAPGTRAAAPLPDHHAATLRRPADDEHRDGRERDGHAGAEVHAKLDTALAYLACTSSTCKGPAATVDLWFGDTLSNWRELTHTLKARFYLHTATRDPSAYALALAQTDSGISTPAHDFISWQSADPNEWNI